MLGYVLSVECPCSVLDKCSEELHSQKIATKDLLSLSSWHSRSFKYCSKGLDQESFNVFFPELMFWSRQNRKLELFLFPIEILGWCSSARCSSTSDFSAYKNPCVTNSGISLQKKKATTVHLLLSVLRTNANQVQSKIPVLNKCNFFVFLLSWYCFIQV